MRLFHLADFARNCFPVLAGGLFRIGWCLLQGGTRAVPFNMVHGVGLTLRQLFPSRPPLRSEACFRTVEETIVDRDRESQPGAPLETGLSLSAGSERLQAKTGTASFF